MMLNKNSESSRKNKKPIQKKSNVFGFEDLNPIYDYKQGSIDSLIRRDEQGFENISPKSFASYVDPNKPVITIKNQHSSTYKNQFGFEYQINTLAEKVVNKIVKRPITTALVSIAYMGLLFYGINSKANFSKVPTKIKSQKVIAQKITNYNEQKANNKFPTDLNKVQEKEVAEEIKSTTTCKSSVIVNPTVREIVTGEKELSLIDIIKKNNGDVISRRQIPVLMYHDISSRGAYNVSPERLRADLDRLKANGNFIISLEEFINKDYSRVPNGKIPTLLTFDDSFVGQLRLNGNSKEGYTLDPNCAVAILDSYFDQHESEIGRGAIFFENANPFGASGKLLGEKLKYLKEAGFDLEYHTLFHQSMAKMSVDKFVRELKIFEEAIRKYNPSYRARAVAYPYGADPNKTLDNYVRSTLKASFDAEFYQPKSRNPDSRYDVPRTEISRRKMSRNNLITYIFNKAYFFKGATKQIAQKIVTKLTRNNHKNQYDDNIKNESSVNSQQGQSFRTRTVYVNTNGITIKKEVEKLDEIKIEPLPINRTDQNYLNLTPGIKLE